MLIYGRSCSLLEHLQLFSVSFSREQEKEFAKVEEYLDPAEDGEACKETHRASNQTKLAFQGYLLVSFNLVVCGRVEVNQYELEIHTSMWRLRTWWRFILQAKRHPWSESGERERLKRQEG